MRNIISGAMLNTANAGIESRARRAALVGWLCLVLAVDRMSPAMTNARSHARLFSEQREAGGEIAPEVLILTRVSCPSWLPLFRRALAADASSMFSSLLRAQSGGGGAA